MGQSEDFSHEGMVRLCAKGLRIEEEKPPNVPGTKRLERDWHFRLRGG